MQQADATRIAALCDQQIVKLLDEPIDATRADIIFGLADLRNMYAGAPDLSEMTPQTASLYGDGTPGNISADEMWEVTKFGFSLGDAVVLNFSPMLYPPRGTVVGFTTNEVKVRWPHDSANGWTGVNPAFLAISTGSR